MKSKRDRETAKTNGDTIKKREGSVKGQVRLCAYLLHCHQQC